MRILQALKVEVSQVELLEKLKSNRELHKAIVVEARKGYLESAKKALSRRLEELAAGKLVSLTFHLVLPTDYTHVYDTAITMYEMHKGEALIELTADQVTSLILDRWDWSKSFYSSTSSYSDRAKMVVDSDPEMQG